MDAKVKKELVELLKAQGMDVAEESVELLINAVFAILPSLAAKTTNTMDDMVVAALAPILQRELLKLADKIDGSEEA